MKETTTITVWERMPLMNVQDAGVKSVYRARKAAVYEITWQTQTIEVSINYGDLTPCEASWVVFSSSS